MKLLRVVIFSFICSLISPAPLLGIGAAAVSAKFAAKTAKISIVSSAIDTGLSKKTKKKTSAESFVDKKAGEVENAVNQLVETVFGAQQADSTTTRSSNPVRTYRRGRYYARYPTRTGRFQGYKKRCYYSNGYRRCYPINKK